MRLRAEHKKIAGALAATLAIGMTVAACSSGQASPRAENAEIPSEDVVALSSDPIQPALQELPGDR